MKPEAEKVGARSIKVSGICCTGNEVLMRQGAPADQFHLSGAADYDQGLDAMIVDIQCIMPGIRAVAEVFSYAHCDYFGQCEDSRAYHVDFVEKTPWTKRGK